MLIRLKVRHAADAEGLSLHNLALACSSALAPAAVFSFTLAVINAASELAAGPQAVDAGMFPFRWPFWLKSAAIAVGMGWLLGHYGKNETGQKGI